MTLSLCNYVLYKFISYYFLCGWLSWHACITVQYWCIFHPPKHNKTLCNSLKNLKTIKGPCFGPRSWSRHQIVYVVLPHTYTNICGNIINKNEDFNERTDTLLNKIYVSHFILERVDVGCVWEVSWRRGQTATYWPKALLIIAALISRVGWVAQPWVTERRKPSVWNWLSRTAEMLKKILCESMLSKKR